MHKPNVLQSSFVIHQFCLPTIQQKMVLHYWSLWIISYGFHKIFFIMLMVFSTTLISIVTKIIVTIIKVGDYNFRNNLSPTMDTSYISMMWYCSESVSSQFCPRKRSHVSFHRNDLPHYFHMCPMQNAHVQGHCFHVF